MLNHREKRAYSKVQSIQSHVPILNLRDLPQFNDILAKNPHLPFIKGYYAEIDLDQHAVFVPDSPAFPDRNGEVKPHGLFDSPLLTLKEWQDRYPENKCPSLLINANWFNVWESGKPGVGKKMDLRAVTHTYLMGLSVSDGRMVSSKDIHNQGDVKLDSIVIDSKTNQANLYFNDEIEENLHNNAAGFLANKNAVSGFILLKNGQPYPSPELNNHHSDRIPRAGLGFKNNGRTLVMIAVHNLVKERGVNADEFRDFFMALGCDNVINLDNNGSVELRYRGSDSMGRPQVIQTQTCDLDLNSSEIPKPNATERPKPNFIGIAKHPARFFSKDDIGFRSAKMKEDYGPANSLATFKRG